MYCAYLYWSQFCVNILLVVLSWHTIPFTAIIRLEVYFQKICAHYTIKYKYFLLRVVYLSSAPIPGHPGEVNHTTVVRILVSLTSVRLTWVHPEENNAQITSYNITYCPSANNGLCVDQPPTIIRVPTMQPTAVLIDLVPLRRYRVYIQAENEVGLGPQPVQPYFFDSADEGVSCFTPGSSF